MPISYQSSQMIMSFFCNIFFLRLSSLEDDVHTFGGCRANMVESNRTCSIPILFKLERALSLKSLYLKKNSKNTSLNLQTVRNQIFNLTIRWSWTKVIKSKNNFAELCHFFMKTSNSKQITKRGLNKSYEVGLAGSLTN